MKEKESLLVYNHKLIKYMVKLLASGTIEVGEHVTTQQVNEMI